MENQLKFFYSKIENNEKIMVQDDGKKADIRWKDRILHTKLASHPFDSFLFHLKDFRPSLYRALQHHPIVTGKYNGMSKTDFNTSKRERHDDNFDATVEDSRGQKVRKSFVQAYSENTIDDGNKAHEYGNDVQECLIDAKSSEQTSFVESLSEDNNSSVEDCGVKGFQEDDDKTQNISGFAMACVVAKCIAEGSLQSHLLAVALLVHEFTIKQSSHPESSFSTLKELPIGNVVATLFENVNCSSNFSDQGSADYRKRPNNAHGLAIRNPFKSCLHLHYSSYRHATYNDINAGAVSVASTDVSQKSDVSRNIDAAAVDCGDNDDDNDDSDNDDDSDDSDDDGDDDEMLAAALAMSMGNSGSDVAVENDHPIEKAEAISSAAVDTASSAIPLLSEVNPMSTFGPFCEEDFWKSVQQYQSVDNDISMLPLRHVVVALLVNVGASVDKMLLCGEDEAEANSMFNESRSSSDMEGHTGANVGDALASLVNSITSNFVASDSKNDATETGRDRTGCPVKPPVDNLPIMTTMPIIPHPISFLLIEVILDMISTNLMNLNSKSDSSVYLEEGKSQKYFLVWCMTVLLKLLKCNFSMLSSCKIPPHTIGLNGPYYSDKQGESSVAFRLMSLVLNCCDSAVIDTISPSFRSCDILGSIYDGDSKLNGEGDMPNSASLYQQKHSNAEYMHAVRFLATHVLASGFSVFYPTVVERLLMVRNILLKVPLNSCPAIPLSEKYCPFNESDINEYSAYSGLQGDQDRLSAMIAARRHRDNGYYDSLLLQYLCLNLVHADDVRASLVQMSRLAVENGDFVREDSTALSELLSNLDRAEKKAFSFNLKDTLQSSESMQLLILQDMERILLERLGKPDLLTNVIPETCEGSEEIVVRSTDCLYAKLTESSSDDNQLSSCVVGGGGGVMPSKSLCFGEICLFRLIAYAYLNPFSHFFSTEDEGDDGFLQFDSEKCSDNLILSNGNRGVCQTRSEGLVKCYYN